jgi:hypothetical protein
MSARQRMEATMADERRLVPRAVAGGVGLLQALQDNAHHRQDITIHMQVLRDPRDGRHAMDHQNLRDIPSQDRQLQGLSDACHLSILEELLELDKLH